MSDRPEKITYPVPWADDPSHSFVASREKYRENAMSAGFHVETEINATAMLDEWRVEATKTHKKGVDLSLVCCVNVFVCFLSCTLRILCERGVWSSEEA
jgi:hypothetical protein